MENIYETVIIFTPEVDTKKLHDYEKLAQTFSDKKKIKYDDLGVKSLAYEVKSKKQGHYLMLTWEGTKENVSDLESKLHADTDVLKFITIKVEEDELEDLDEENVESEQAYDANAQVDALDVILGFSDYTKKGEK